VGVEAGDPEDRAHVVVAGSEREPARGDRRRDPGGRDDRRGHRLAVRRGRHLDRELGGNDPVGLLALALEQQLQPAVGDRVRHVEVLALEVLAHRLGRVEQDAAVPMDHAQRPPRPVAQPALDRERHPRPVAVDPAHA
jgi:hypothetical protein